MYGFHPYSAPPPGCHFEPSSSTSEPFPIKLYKLLEASPPQIIRWTRSGQGFIIEDGTLMCIEILPRYFRHEKLASFQRQLNLCVIDARARGAHRMCCPSPYVLGATHVTWPDWDSSAFARAS